ncbi:MAG: hypothetical protein IJI43_01635 [Bacilli bacterium]|nr:hypothetical protein [Bacilli bacterium]
MDLDLMNIDGLVTVAKKPGVKNCVRVSGVDDIPDYLKDSITVEGDNLILDCLEGKETVPIGSVIAFEKLDNGKMNVWNKANWRETTKEVDGVFYDIPKPYKAFPVTDELPPTIVEKFGDKLKQAEDGTYELTTSWGVVSCKPNNGYLMIYGEHDDGSLSANFLTKGTPSFEEYYISNADGELKESLKDYDQRLHEDPAKDRTL